MADRDFYHEVALSAFKSRLRSMKYWNLKMLVANKGIINRDPDISEPLDEEEDVDDGFDVPEEVEELGGDDENGID